ncbi:CG34455 [Drosophila busckii]|uniref:Pyridoxal kinase n=1 Tax=Drosophila busckii TaxID=30019 RepID=A0A0M4E8P6_DROBS|nr:pyridoxal kinase [Drosophila busckii]XP_017842919.1 pyridoxal kinase [Drosophila busckii]ALC43291.1 CG34455 [Drosophila busckii]
MTSTTEKRVLSIQSSVVFGYVGNKVATYPLQLLGFDVDPLNSVQFSNHTGYKCFNGPVATEKELADIFEGLKGNELLSHYSHLLTGYIGNPLFLRQVGVILKQMRAANPKLIYVCDPVMGDNGSMYVPKELLPVYRDEIIPLADIITPNQFEVEMLTGKPINDEAGIWQAMEWFHERKIKTVVISSSDLGQPGMLRAFLSQLNGPQLAIDIPKQGDKGLFFTGTGDLFASLFLAHSYDGQDVCEAFEKTVATLQAVIKRTVDALPTQNGAATACERELKLVQSKAEIEQPKVLLKAQRIK